MNEEAIQDVYNLFVRDGYGDSIEDFQELLNTNEEAVNDAYKLFVGDGYGDTVLDFVELMGIGEKKNPVGTGTGEEEVMVSDTPTVQEPGSSGPSPQPRNEEVDSALAAPVDTNNLINPEVLSSEDTDGLFYEQDGNAIFNFSNNNTETDFFEQSLEQINADLIDEEEQTVVPLMSYHFNDYGFEFEETGVRDAMKVKSSNGKKITIDLDPATGNLLGFESKGADKLTQFLRDNKDESFKLHQLEAGYVQKEAKIQNKKEAKKRVKEFDSETNLVRDDINAYLSAKSFYDSHNMSEMDPDEVVYVEGPDGNQMATTPSNLLEKINTANKNIEISKKNLAIKGKELDDVIGGWYGMRTKQNSILGFSYNAFLDGSARIASNYANKLFDLGTYVQGPVGSGLMSKDDYRTRVLTKAREAGALGKTYTDKRIKEIIKNDEEYERLKEIIQEAIGTETEVTNPTLFIDEIPTTTIETTSLLEDIESKILDELRKKAKYDVDPGEVQYSNPFSQFANDPSLDDKMGMLEATRGGLRDVIGIEGTTVEATKEAKKGFWGGALIGVTESIPAMLGPAPIRILNMISQVEDHINEEMQNDRSFDNISEVEKAVFTLPLGIVVGVLENIGFRNAIAQKGLASKILLRVLKKNKDITGQTFRQVVKKEVNSMMTQGILLVSASGLAEFETGLAQEIADIGFKEAYNAIKEKDMFTTPESWADGFQQVIRAGAQEAVGGFVIGTPSAIIQTATAGDFTGLGDGVFEMYEDIRNEPIVRSAFIQKIKQSILEGTKTKKEGDREIALYDQVNGVMDKIPGDLPTNQKKELLGNLLRQQELQDDIDKYNKLLTKRQQQELLDLENDVERIVRSGNAQNQQEAQETELNTQAINELKEEGIENPTPEQINKKKKELQKQEGKSQEVEVTDKEARESLELDNKLNEEMEKRGMPNSGQKLITQDAINKRKQKLKKEKQDAIQESSTESVDVQESTESSQEVGDGNTQGNITNESIQDQTDTDTKSQEEVDDLTAIVNEQTGMQEQSEQEQEGTPEQPTRKTVVQNEEDGTLDIIVSDGKNIVVPGVSVSNNVHVSESSEPGIKGKLQGLTNSLLKQAKNAGKSIIKLIPDLDIIIHADENNYNRSVSKSNAGTRGTFNMNTNTIHINASKANTRTVAHEVMHAVLLKKLGIDSKKYSKITGKMLQAVIKGLPKDSNLKEVIEDFAKDYALEEQNEEKVSELFGYLSAAYTQLDGPTKNIVKRWLQKVAKAVGLPTNITEFTKEEADMIEFFNTVSKKVREGTEVTEGDIEVIDDGTAPIGTPTTINKPSKTEKPQIDFKKSYDMSLVTPDNKIDLLSLVDKIVKNNEKVWFWVADQLGLGNGMDAGPSFALQPENIEKGAIWASGLDAKKLEKNITAADFIFIISGSPETSKLFNKKVFDKYANNLGDYNTFKKKALATNPTKAIKETLEEFDSWPAMRRSPKRKNFLIAVNEQSKKPNTKFHALVNTLGGFVDLQSLRDGFYKENEFAQNDIMMVLKPTGLGGKSNHSTYANNILGEVVGVPDIKLNAEEIMPAAVKAKIKGKGISEKTSSIAPYGGAVSTAVKSVTKPSTEKAQKAPVDRLAKMYEMNNNGVIFNKPGVDRVSLEDWANSLGFKVEPTRGDIGELTGFKLIKPDGKAYKPTKEKAQKSVDEKAQKAFNKFDTPLQIINKARGLNFTDGAILDYLTRVRKFTKTEVRDLMKVNADLLNIIPPSMGNIVGGMKAGIKLFNKVSNHYNKLIKKNAKAKTKLSEQEIMDQAMDFLRAQPEYKKMADAALKGISTEQMVLEMDVARALGGKQSSDLISSIRNARIILKSKTKGQKELRKIQRELRNFMRKTLPVDIYSKSDALKLMKKIQDASKDNIQEVMNEVMEFAATKNNVRLDKSILDLLDPKNTVKRISNVLKGVKIDEGTRKRLAYIKKRIDAANKTKDEKTGKIRESVIEDVVKYLNKLEAEYDAINKKPVKTEADYTDMADLNIIINMVNANKLMGNKDITKVSILTGVETELKQIITAGRTLLKEQLRKAHAEYRRQFEHVYQDVTGREESFEDQAKRELKEDGVENPTEAEIFDKVTDIIEELKVTKKTRERENASKVKKVKGRFKKLANNIVQRLGNIMGMNSDLFLLMDKISLLPAELFEGVTQEEITKKIDAANREMKGRMLINDALIISKFQELFGRKYKSIVTSFGRKTEVFILPDGTDLDLSPNQMYYLYNQYKDSANHPGLEKTFSTDSKGLVKVMNEMTTRLESEQYKDLKEFADWQVDILYPMLYNHYNEAYKDIYRTQMPYNVNYAGMVYRDGFEAEGVRLIPGTEQQKPNFHNVISANSTKMRENNKRAIQPTDGTNALYTYMRDMEYFSAYARPVNDINKLFTNDLIESEITKLHGATTLTAIKMAIQKIANKGTAKDDVKMDNAVDIMQEMFILSRLGINPVVTLKQLTSFVTYASDIGYINWMKNAALSRFGKGQDVKAVWKEIAANSTYLQDRDAKSMTKAIEMYSDAAMESIFPDITVGGKRLMTGANKESLVNILMYTVKVGDRGAIYLGGVPNYVYYKNKALKDGKTEEEAIKEAIIKFERDTKRSQQSTDLQDRDAYQTKGPIFRALNMFLTTPRQYLRKEVYAMRNMYRLVSSGGKSGKGTKTDAGRIFLTYHVVMPMFFQYVALGMPGLLADWEDEDAKDLGMAAILGNINALFLYGDLAVMIKNLLSDKPEAFLTADSLPILTQGSEAAKKISRYMKLKDPKKKQEALYAALAETSQFTGLPVNNLRKIFKNMEKLIEGGEDPEKVILRLFNFGEYQILNEAERKRSKKSKKKAIKKVKEKVQDNSIFKDSKKNDNSIFKTDKKNDNRIFK